MDAQLRALPRNTEPSQRLEILWQSYEEGTGAILNRPPTLEERRSVWEWLRGLRAYEPFPTYIVSGRHVKLAVSLSLVEKAAGLVQHWCTACQVIVRPNGEIPFQVSFPIPVTPWSAQSSKRRAAIRQGVHEALRARGYFTPRADDGICLSIVSLVPRSAPVKDTDNLIKGLLDSMQGILYVDDKQVQCLTSRRVEYGGLVGMYFVSARAVSPWDADVVYDDPTPPRVV
jgi:Holliday junction resolvase RusA-like endonuclease